MGEDEFLTFLAELTDAESDLGEAMAACKGPRKDIKDIKKRIAERMSIEAFERARADRMKPGHQRVEEAAEYARAMAWLGRPIGNQSAMEFTVKNPGDVELKAIDIEGYEAGRAGHDQTTNTYTPGDERWARFQTSWQQGWDAWMKEQTERAEDLAPEPKRRGRPKKGSGKKNAKAKPKAKAGAAAAQPDPSYDDEGGEPLPLGEGAPTSELVH
jgi:hypothetical protein